ncbi:response regulator [Simiduia aestuariiviva]|uniref:DNA-binding response OmpR family regulator n=1 Tax=Simiduia aestuariiviva TaxID=1510459 RepID=A0A839UW73_9GAMM|nr:response regulator [Simiduia aestuariiviva]MBB3169607.1 DNA-binding response OmpR family regulator [Simiduia aestuariiviva]
MNQDTYDCSNAGDGFTKPIEILLVEDNPLDARLTIEALKESGQVVVKHIHHVTDGEQAIAFLDNKPPFSDSPKPDFVLLDINLPKVNGKEVLTFLRAHKVHKLTPVVMLTTSLDDRDIIAAYDLKVNAYVAKPIEFEEFLAAIRSLESFWLSTTKLPPNRS